MDPFQTCERLLSHVKCSNLNFSLSESPFSVSLSIRKSFVKDKHGFDRRSQSFSGIHQVDEKPILEKENKHLKSLVTQQEHEKEAFEHTIHELGQKLEKAKAELIEIMSEKDTLEKGKNITETELDKKNCELADTAEFATNLKNENKVLHREIKNMSQVIDIKGKEIIKLKLKNETQSESCDRIEIEVETFTKNKIQTEKENQLQQSILPQTKPPKVSSFSLPCTTLNTISTDLSPGPSTGSTQDIIEHAEDTQYNIETNNNFECLAEPEIEASKDRKPNVPVVDCKLAKIDKIDYDNYTEALLDFFENFRETSTETPKYVVIAGKMMKNKHNVFHMDLKDIRKFNHNLGGFLAAHHRNIESDVTKLIEKFIKDQDLGVLCHGLYFYIKGCK